jgi:hypothetical protein
LMGISTRKYRQVGSFPSKKQKSLLALRARGLS